MNADQVQVGDRVTLAALLEEGADPKLYTEGTVVEVGPRSAVIAWVGVPDARLHFWLHELAPARAAAADDLTEIEYDVDLEVCTDCVMLIANDEIEEIRRAEHVTAILHRLGLPRILGWLVVNGDEPHFSTSPCDACGSPLAGDRLSAVAGSPVRAEHDDPLADNPYDMDTAEIATTNVPSEPEVDDEEASLW